MTFANLVAGDSVFVDANSFIYQFAPDPVLGPPCSQLFQRIENQELAGFTSIHLLAEVAHKLMTIEANALFGWQFAGMANRLRRHPTEVQRLTAFRRAIEQISQSHIQVLPIPVAVLVAAAAVCQQTGLLINDALAVMVMQANGLTKLASHDSDFDRVPGLTRYAPVWILRGPAAGVLRRRLLGGGGSGGGGSAEAPGHSGIFLRPRGPRWLSDCSRSMIRSAGATCF